jgi:hypothetical protein
MKKGSSMKKATIAVATSAIAIAAPGVFVAPAEAHCGANHGFVGHATQYYRPPQSVSRSEPRSVPRRKPAVSAQPVEKPGVAAKSTEKPAVAAKPAEKPAPQQAEAAPAAKYLDGRGRQFDLASKVWFDGKSQCWQGDQAFTFRSDGWFYGNAHWVETNNGWGVSSGALPRAVSCDGVQVFAAKVQSDQARPAASSASADPSQVATSRQTPKFVANPEPRPAPAAAKPPAPECKEYFPAVGEMVVVPCKE